MKRLLFLLCLVILPAQAFEDCVISTDGKLSDIKIEKNDIVDVYPLITVMNEKNTLIIHPLKEGSTRFSVLKNNKEKFVFNVHITQEKTVIDDVAGFDILQIDSPPEVYDYELDLPPGLSREGGKTWTN